MTLKRKITLGTLGSVIALSPIAAVIACGGGSGQIAAPQASNPRSDQDLMQNISKALNGKDFDKNVLSKFIQTPQSWVGLEVSLQTVKSSVDGTFTLELEIKKGTETISKHLVSFSWDQAGNLEFKNIPEVLFGYIKNVKPSGKELSKDLEELQLELKAAIEKNRLKMLENIKNGKFVQLLLGNPKVANKLVATWKQFLISNSATIDEVLKDVAKISLKIRQEKRANQEWMIINLDALLGNAKKELNEWETEIHLVESWVKANIAKLEKMIK